MSGSPESQLPGDRRSEGDPAVPIPAALSDSSGSRNGHWRKSRQWSPPPAEAIEWMFPNCQVVELIGRGGMGAVYRGLQTNLDRPVAIKILPPDVADADPGFVERFQREARSMARLSHPNIVSIYDAGTTESGVPYLVMELVDGADVAQIIASEGPLVPGDAVRITSGVCDALTFAHASGIIHRDISPSNIMVNRSGGVKVADFGLAKLESDDLPGLTSTSVVVGKPDFIAPEAIYDAVPPDARSDIYAVGVSLYQMITGRLPRGNYASPSQLIPSLHPGFDAIIDRALEPNPQSRYSSTAELKRDLERISRDGRHASLSEEWDASAPTIAYSRPSSLPIRGTSSSKPVRPVSTTITLALVGCLALLGGAFWWIRNESPESGSGSVLTPNGGKLPEDEPDSVVVPKPLLPSSPNPARGTTSVRVVTQTSLEASSVQFLWEWANPRPQGNHLAGLLWDGRSFLAVGDRNTILRSEDGLSWDSVAPPGIPWYGGVAHNGSRYVLVGSAVVGRRPIQISEDGENWIRLPVEGPHLEDVIWTGREFLAVGWQGALARSENGRDDWRWLKLGNAGLNHAAYNGLRYVVVGDAGGLFVSEDALNWRSVNLSLSEDLHSVQWSGTRWVGAGRDGVTLYSDDGLAWDYRLIGGAPPFLAGHRVGNDVLVGGGSGWILGHLPAGTWQGFESPTTLDIQCFAHDGNRVVAGGKYGTILFSGDGGRSWRKASETVTEADLRSVAASPTGLVAVGSSGSILKSADARIWEVVPSGTTETLACVIWTGTEFVATGGGSTVLSSSDGLRWRAAADVPSSVALLGLSSSHAGMVAVGLHGTILTSRDGRRWTLRESGVSANLNSVTWTGTEFVAVGDGSTIVRSTDGSEWTAVHAPAVGNLRDVTWTGEKLLAVSEFGKAISSPDFENWSMGELLLFTGTATSILHYEGVAMAAGFFGSCSLSADFQEWTGSGSLVEPTGNHLRDHLVHKGLVVAVGDGGTILVAPWIGTEFLQNEDSQ